MFTRGFSKSYLLLSFGLHLNTDKAKLNSAYFSILWDLVRENNVNWNVLSQSSSFLWFCFKTLQKLTLIVRSRLAMGELGSANASFKEKCLSSCNVSFSMEGGEKTMLWSPIKDLLWKQWIHFCFKMDQNLQNIQDLTKENCRGINTKPIIKCWFKVKSCDKNGAFIIEHDPWALLYKKRLNLREFRAWWASLRGRYPRGLTTSSLVTSATSFPGMAYSERQETGVGVKFHKWSLKF